MVEHIVHTDGVVGSNPAVRTIFRRLVKRLVSSPFMLMHKRAYSNDNRVFVLPALNCTEVNQNQFSWVQLEKWFSFDSVKDTPSGSRYIYHPSFFVR